MPSRETEAIGLFIHMIRKIWKGHHQDASKGRTPPHLKADSISSDDVRMADRSEKVSHRIEDDTFKYHRNAPGVASGDGEVKYFSWNNKRAKSSGKCFGSAESPANNTDYRNNVFFKKFKIKASEYGEKKMKDNRK